jgi:hypothetical protein
MRGILVLPSPRVPRPLSTAKPIVIVVVRLGEVIKSFQPTITHAYNKSQSTLVQAYHIPQPDSVFHPRDDSRGVLHQSRSWCILQRIRTLDL